jgi:hypothetical protein
MFQSAQEPLDLMQRFMRADCRITPDYGIVLVESRRSRLFAPFFLLVPYYTCTSYELR